MDSITRAYYMPYMHVQLHVKKCLDESCEQALSDVNGRSIFTSTLIHVCWDNLDDSRNVEYR